MCEPDGSDPTDRVAAPVASTSAVPTGVAPSTKATLPVGPGDAGAGPVTRAVIVTGWPATAGVGDDAICTALAPWRASSPSGNGVTPDANEAAPPYAAASEGVPAGGANVRGARPPAAPAPAPRRGPPVVKPPPPGG